MVTSAYVRRRYAAELDYCDKYYDKLCAYFARDYPRSRLAGVGFRVALEWYSMPWCNAWRGVEFSAPGQWRPRTFTRGIVFLPRDVIVQDSNAADTRRVEEVTVTFLVGHDDQVRIETVDPETRTDRQIRWDAVLREATLDPAGFDRPGRYTVRYSIRTTEGRYVALTDGHEQVYCYDQYTHRCVQTCFLPTYWTGEMVGRDVLEIELETD